MHLVWHRTELRTHDHPALDAAARSGEAVLPLVIIDPVIFGRPTTTPRRQAWFLENVRALRESYRALGSDLVVREGVPHEVLGRLAREAKVTHAHYIRNHTPYAKERDGAADRALIEAGVEVHTYPGQYTHPPGEVLTGAGTRYSVFGPYRTSGSPCRCRSWPRPPTDCRPSRGASLAGKSRSSGATSPSRTPARGPPWPGWRRSSATARPPTPRRGTSRPGVPARRS